MIKIFGILKLIKIKLIRIKDFPESVAIGLAWGASISVTPLLGLHLIICYAGTWLMRGNMIAATVGTVIGNPWTFPFFFYLDYKIGILFYFKEMSNYEFTISFLINNFDNLFFPTFIGSIPLSIIVWFLTFFFTKKVLSKRYYGKNKTRS